jgi:hypothetical protein
VLTGGVPYRTLGRPCFLRHQVPSPTAQARIDAVGVGWRREGKHTAWAHAHTLHSLLSQDPVVLAEMETAQPANKRARNLMPDLVEES